VGGYAGDDVVDYQFMGTDPNSADNRWLLDAMQQQIPVIYFLGISPGRYQPIIPTFIVGWYPERLRVPLAFGALVGASAQAVPPDAPERRYALREIKARLHQASFKDAVLSAYRGRCAISHLPEPRLLDAAPHRDGCGRAIRTAGDLEWPTDNEAPSCRLRCPPDRDRPRFPNSRL
jgi:putative restriction endonuclease